jgi:molecular chaperone DnaJ
VVTIPDKLSNQAKELLKQFDAESGDSLNAAKGLAKEDKTPNDSKDKKKKFWK